MKKCDLVMKGGITSGIVYPGAVLELSREFQFASIGGTSAGAIAAALTAAAEFRRQSGDGDAGFESIAGLPTWMAETDRGRSRLLRLFQPSSETEPLFETALAFIETKGSRRTKGLAALRALMSGFTEYGSMAAVAGVALIAIAIAAAWMSWASWIGVGMLFVVATLLGLTAVAVVVATIVEAMARALETLPRHGFGLCSGMTRGDTPGLTEWLSDQIDKVAGLAHPLTFGDLRSREIHLEMMTTNLTHGRPYRLPIDSRHYLFAPSEMRRLFPERIVQWMMDRAPGERRRQTTAHGEELFPLPAAADLPVVVATRMSVSFPLLLSAVPLWAIDFGRQPLTYEPERCWFSDGGITSNFPVHFFDAPIPRWPTFAINLAQRSPRYHQEGQRIYVPRTNRGGISEWWSPFEDLAGFLRSILSTMQNWRDNMLLHLPGQRDRIAHVLLGEEEGGLNLSMDEATIADVAGRGAAAGRAFRERFGGSPPSDVKLTWANHKWVRYLSFMAALEEALGRWERAFDDESEGASFREMVSGPRKLPSYRPSVEERAKIRDASLAFLQHIGRNFNAGPFRGVVRRPKPEPELRAMPRE